MKNLLLFLFAFLFAVPVFAVTPPSSEIDLSMKLEIEGKQVASPRMIIAFGQKATVTQQSVDGSPSIYVEVEPIQQSKKTALLNVTLQRIDRGETEVLGVHKVTVESGREAVVAREGAGHPSIKFTVVPKF